MHTYHMHTCIHMLWLVREREDQSQKIFEGAFSCASFDLLTVSVFITSWGKTGHSFLLRVGTKRTRNKKMRKAMPQTTLVQTYRRPSPADAGDHGGAWLLPFPVWLQLGVRAALRSFLVDLFVPKIKLRERV
jgi:hypothetical protein